MARAQARRRVERRIEALLEGSLGLNVFWKRSAASSPSSLALSTNPLAAGFQMAALYLIVFVVAPWLVLTLGQGYLPKSFWALANYQIYGALWSGWAATATRLASRSVKERLADEILPGLEEKALNLIRKDLDRHHRPRLVATSWAIGIAGATAAAILISWDLRQEAGSQWLILWWSAGWTLLYATAAKVVMVGSFYRRFGDALAEDFEQLFWVDPGRSALVMSVAALGKRMLLFWCAIAASIALVIPFGIVGWVLRDEPRHAAQSLPTLGNLVWGADTFNLAQSYFVAGHFVVTTLFSIGAGSLVFLRSELGIRRAVRRASLATLRTIEKEAAELRAVESGSEDQIKRLEELKALHEEVASAGGYRSVVKSVISLLLPVVPLLTLLFNIWVKVAPVKPA